MVSYNVCYANVVFVVPFCRQNSQIIYRFVGNQRKIIFWQYVLYKKTVNIKYVETLSKKHNISAQWLYWLYFLSCYSRLWCQTISGASNSLKNTELGRSRKAWYYVHVHSNGYESTVCCNFWNCDQFRTQPWENVDDNVQSH